MKWRAGKPVDLYGLIRGWFGIGSRTPAEDVIGLALGEAESLGLFEGGHRAGQVEFKPRCERIAGLEAQFTRFAARWREFQEREPALHAALVAQSARAIEESRELPESGPVGELLAGTALGDLLRSVRERFPWTEHAFATVVALVRLLIRARSRFL
ncbi:MAG: hypothetical protein M3Q65_04520 [Chloroflexota bacterium]|nr:hypothetical protein [Chloroflexota bacterium]